MFWNRSNEKPKGQEINVRADIEVETETDIGAETKIDPTWWTD
jgi:hypothetical protein